MRLRQQNTPTNYERQKKSVLIPPQCNGLLEDNMSGNVLEIHPVYTSGHRKFETKLVYRKKFDFIHFESFYVFPSSSSFFFFFFIFLRSFRIYRLICRSFFTFLGANQKLFTVFQIIMRRDQKNINLRMLQVEEKKEKRKRKKSILLETISIIKIALSIFLIPPL